MDQNGTNRSNKYNHLFSKKTLQFLVSISVISFLLAYASCFSFIFTYNFHFSTLLFALFSRAIERKYMFLICNGILAFLVNTLSSSSPPPPHVTDFIHDESMKATEDQKPKSSVPSEETTVLPVQYYSSISDNLEVKEQEEEEEKQEKEGFINVSDKQEEKAPDESGKQRKSQMGPALIIASDDIYSSDFDDDYETDIEESAAAAAASLLGKSSVAEDGNEINLNTEELNQKFEEFIRKMKEEIRIEAQQQLVVA